MPIIPDGKPAGRTAQAGRLRHHPPLQVLPGVVVGAGSGDAVRDVFVFVPVPLLLWGVSGCCGGCKRFVLVGVLFGGGVFVFLRG